MPSRAAKRRKADENGADPRRSRTFEELDRGLRDLEERLDLEYLSRWGLERLLDQVAGLVANTFRSSTDDRLGCSVLYRAAGSDPPKYVLGGSSVRRVTMEPAAVHYELTEHAHNTSFTAHAIRHRVSLAVDSLKHPPARVKNVRHTPKWCELPPNDTLSYVAVPACESDELRQSLEGSLDDSASVTPATNEDLPICLIRITFATSDRATPTIRDLLTDDGIATLTRAFALMRRAIDGMKDDNALAIANLTADLLRYRGSEYAGLDELCFHLQTIFGECECSVFLAHPRTNVDPRETHLYLAATTAQSPSDQHCKFRDWFFRKRNHYTCFTDESGQPVPPADGHIAKTERAFNEPREPVYEPNSEGKGKFSGSGEHQQSTSFLAIAIPSRSFDKPAYGVVRLVRGKKIPFTESDKKLAAAIAKNLTFWMELFPRNNDLQITWAPPEKFRRDTLSVLFDLPVSKLDDFLFQADVEFEALLRKIFVKSNSITIKNDLGGYSGAVVLEVENDSGMDLILKCAKKSPEEPSNLIEQEAKNYRDYIEGKIALNHNVIYPELVRETRRVNGFATSFLGLGSSQRMTILQYIKMGESPEVCFPRLRRVVDKVVDVWDWWYRHVEPMSTPCRDFRKSALRPGDLGWLLEQSQGLEALDYNVHDANSRLHRPEEPQSKPSEVWTAFTTWLQSQDFPVEWERGITHGDLNGGNIFVDLQSTDVWLIDFAGVGYRASVFDLAKLEAEAKYSLLPFLLKKHDLLDDPSQFVEEFAKIEEAYSRQTSYSHLVLGDIEAPKNEKALDTLRALNRLIIHIRFTLHFSLGRRGCMLDYLIILALLSYRYMGVRGASDHYASDVQVLLASKGSRILMQSIRDAAAARAIS